MLAGSASSRDRRKKIKIPNEWQPRPYQIPLWEYLESGGKRAVVVWHRRAGKDSASLNWTCVAAHNRVGTYWHMLPTAKHGRKVVWDAIDKVGRRMIDQVFPEVIRRSTNQQEMRIELLNGSIWQVVGSDNYDSLVGANPVGVVFSEYSVANPKAWDFISPILTENGGWCFFIFTPRGHNHGYDIYTMANDHPDWFAQIVTVDDSTKSGHVVFSEAQLEDLRKSGFTDDLIKQEYYCSFSNPVRGSYYADLLDDMERKKRVVPVPYDPAVPVTTAWDLGINDMTAIWFAQQVGREVHIIDFYENRGHGLQHYAGELFKRPYVYDQHLLPHDAKARELGTGMTRQETLGKLGIRCTIVGRQPVADGIQAVRNLIPRCWFDDSQQVQRGLACLKEYRTAEDTINKTFKPRPVHDWTSHAADGFRYLALGMRDSRVRDRGGPSTAVTDWDILNPGVDRRRLPAEELSDPWILDW